MPKVQERFFPPVADDLFSLEQYQLRQNLRLVSPVFIGKICYQELALPLHRPDEHRMLAQDPKDHF